jgi:hypothetical protein
MPAEKIPKRRWRAAAFLMLPFAAFVYLNNTSLTTSASFAEENVPARKTAPIAAATVRNSTDQLLDLPPNGQESLTCIHPCKYRHGNGGSHANSDEHHGGLLANKQSRGNEIGNTNSQQGQDKNQQSEAAAGILHLMSPPLPMPSFRRPPLCPKQSQPQSTTNLEPRNETKDEATLRITVSRPQKQRKHVFSSPPTTSCATAASRSASMTS